LTIGSDPAVPESSLGHIMCYTVNDQGDIFIYDIKNNDLKIFDRQGRYLRSFGRRGQGPGEFQIAENIQWTSRGELMLCDMAKPIFFSDDGRFLREVKTNAKFGEATYITEIRPYAGKPPGLGHHIQI